MPENDVEQFVTEARLIVANAGYDPEYYFVDDKGGDAPYYFYTQNPDDPKNLIYVEDGYARPSMREISEVSAAVRGLQKGYRIHRICFPSELKDEIAAFYHA
jgi:HD superfamily phosphohydrolases